MYVTVTMEHYKEDEEGNMVLDEDRENNKEIFEKVFLAKVSMWGAVACQLPERYTAQPPTPCTLLPSSCLHARASCPGLRPAPHITKYWPRG